MRTCQLTPPSMGTWPLSATPLCDKHEPSRAGHTYWTGKFRARLPPQLATCRKPVVKLWSLELFPSRKKRRITNLRSWGWQNLCMRHNFENVFFYTVEIYLFCFAYIGTTWRSTLSRPLAAGPTSPERSKKPTELSSISLQKLFYYIPSKCSTLCTWTGLLHVSDVLEVSVARKTHPTYFNINSSFRCLHYTVDIYLTILVNTYRRYIWDNQISRCTKS